MSPPRRPESPPLEKRATDAPVTVRDITSRRIGGRAATFRSPSENLGGFVERVDPRFFSKSQGDGWPGDVPTTSTPDLGDMAADARFVARPDQWHTEPTFDHHVVAADPVRPPEDGAPA